MVNVESALLDKKQINEMVYEFVTDDPVFGYITPLSMHDFYDQEKLSVLKQQLNEIKEGVICVYGAGASLLASNPDILIYADMPRWEIQLRFRRKEVGNFGADNANDAFSYQYKRAFFVDWRVFDRLKVDLFGKWDYALDTTKPGEPKMVTGAALREALDVCITRPFRVVPFFDPGPWGGQWLKEVCDLEKTEKNFA